MFSSSRAETQPMQPTIGAWQIPRTKKRFPIAGVFDWLEPHAK
jgi:hypothetical protein